MKRQHNRCFRWLALLIVPVLTGTACSVRPIQPRPALTATSVADSGATQPALSTPSPEPTATQVSVPSNSPDSDPQEDVLYKDDFTDPGSGWSNALVFDNYYIGYHEPEFYHVEVHEQDDRAVVVLPEHSFNDFTAEADVLADEANTAPEGDFRYGLVVRRSGNRFYAFTISPRTQTWYVLKSSAADLQIVKQGSDASIQAEGETDTLRVDADGSTFTFHINGRPVSQMTDPEYTTGEIGFYVETFDAPRAHIHYDSLTIREFAESEPGQDDTTAKAVTPTPTSPALLCMVVTPMLYLRSGPSVMYEPPVGSLPSGTALEPLARSPDALWIQVRVLESGELGWVTAAAAYVSCNVVVGELSVSEPPPTPTSSAS